MYMRDSFMIYNKRMAVRWRVAFRKKGCGHRVRCIFLVHSNACMPKAITFKKRREEKSPRHNVQYIKTEAVINGWKWTHAIILLMTNIRRDFQYVHHKSIVFFDNSKTFIMFYLIHPKFKNGLITFWSTISKNTRC
jgi:hypothetical protein